MTSQSKQMILEMRKGPNYPKHKLDEIIKKDEGDMTDCKISHIYASWSLAMPLPPRKHKYYTDEDTGEWQDWTTMSDSEWKKWLDKKNG